jgi:hypothetical protein
MSEFTSIGAKHAVAKRFRAIADSHRLRNHQLLERMVGAIERLSLEQQARELGLAYLASPSDGDAGQSDKTAFAKQAQSHRPTARRQRGAA